MKLVPTASQLIRPTEPGDLAAMKGIIDATGLFPAEMLDDMFSPENNLDSPSLWLVAGLDGLVGLAYAAPERMTAGSWNVLLIAVHPDHQGTGVGSALMAEIEAMVAVRGAHLLLVETSGLVEFEATRRFYQQRGYEKEARIRDYYQPGEDKIVFRKSLTLP